MQENTYQLRGIKPVDIQGIGGNLTAGIELFYFNGENSQTYLRENGRGIELVVRKPFTDPEAGARYARSMARYLGTRIGKRVTLWSR